MSEGATRVLIAEDNAVDRKVLSSIVKAAGFEVTDAVDGNDAIDKYHAEAPDLVLLDALMPGKDGFQVAEEIRSSSGDSFVPIIFLTSLTEATELARCLEAGGDDFLSKPYNRVILQAKLNAFERMREMHHTVQSQRDEISKHHMQLLADQEAAKAVFDNVAHSRQLECSYIRHLLSPLAIFNGDVLLATHTPAQHLCVLLGDFTGHGLAAAIGAMPLADVFYGMTAKGFSLSEILRECNRKLGSVLPSGYFCCATAMVIDFNRCTVEYWNGGLPSAYLRHDKTNAIVPLESKNLPLGILAPDKFKDETLVIEAFPGDRIFLATDGVVEARNEAKEYFGVERLERLVAEVEIDQLFDTVQEEVYTYMNGRDDDITMVEVKIVTPEEVETAEVSQTNELQQGPLDWKFTYELGPQSLKEFNPLPLLQQVLMEAPYLRSRSSKIYTVLAELYSNGLEHGVLGLDSKLKHSAEGFAQYYAARAQALERVVGFVRFEMSGQLVGKDVDLWITVTDSGPGFDHQALVDKATAGGASANQYHGRGVRLLWDLCEEVAYTAPGNKVSVHLKWSEDDE